MVVCVSCMCVLCPCMHVCSLFSHSGTCYWHDHHPNYHRHHYHHCNQTCLYCFGFPTFQLNFMMTRALRGQMEVPEAWRKSKLILLFKMGDRQLPQNYRPIAIVPVLCKLYSMLLLGRVVRVIDQALPVEQAGFAQGWATATTCTLSG